MEKSRTEVLAITQVTATNTACQDTFIGNSNTDKDFKIEREEQPSCVGPSKVPHPLTQSKQESLFAGIGSDYR